MTTHHLGQTIEEADQKAATEARVTWGMEKDEAKEKKISEKKDKKMPHQGNKSQMKKHEEG